MPLVAASRVRLLCGRFADPDTREHTEMLRVALRAELPANQFFIMSLEDALRFGEEGEVCVFVLKDEHIELGLQIASQLRNGVAVILLVEKDAPFLPDLKDDFKILPESERSRLIVRTWTNLVDEGVSLVSQILPKILQPEPSLF